MVIFYRSEEDVEQFVRHPLSTVGSDGNARRIDGAGVGIHPRSFGTFRRVLGRYVRERRAFTLDDAVNKMSGEPACPLGLGDRGIIREGLAADLILFDPETVADRAEFAQTPHPPVRIDVVMVNGTIMVDHGTVSVERPGRVLLRRRRSTGSRPSAVSPSGGGRE